MRVDGHEMTVRYNLTTLHQLTRISLPDLDVDVHADGCAAGSLASALVTAHIVRTSNVQGKFLDEINDWFETPKAKSMDLVGASGGGWPAFSRIQLLPSGRASQ